MACIERRIENGQVVERECRSSAKVRGGPRSAAQKTTPEGAGTELKAILRKWFGIEASATCSCNSMARKMDAHGPDWSEGEGMPEVLAVMRAEHARRKLLLPWSDMVARGLVRLACRRARARNRS